MSKWNAQVRSGAPFADVLIVACHAHIGVGWNHPTNDSNAQKLVSTMDAVGIDVSCISSMRAIGPDLVGGNDEIARAVENFPERLVGTAVANPHFPAESRADLESRFASGRFGMIKVHPEFHAYPMDGPAYDRTYEFAAKHRIPVLTHSWGFGRGFDHPRRALDLARRHPDLRLILGHAGGTPDGLAACVEVVSECSNIYLDTGTSLVYRGSIEFLVQHAGAERVLFGTDAVYLADAPQVTRIVGSRIDDAAKRKILGENLGRLLSEADVPLRPEWTDSVE